MHLPEGQCEIQPTSDHEFIARKFRSYNMIEYLAEPKHLASAYRKLRYAGFSSSVVVKVLKRYSERAEEIEE